MQNNIQQPEIKFKMGRPARRIAFLYRFTKQTIYIPRGTNWKKFMSEEKFINYTIDNFSHEYLHHLLYNIESIIASKSIDNLRAEFYDETDATGLWLKEKI